MHIHAEGLLAGAHRNREVVEGGTRSHLLNLAASAAVAVRIGLSHADERDGTGFEALLE